MDGVDARELVSKHVEWVILNSYEEEESPPEMPVLRVGAVGDHCFLSVGTPNPESQEVDYKDSKGAFFSLSALEAVLAMLRSRRGGSPASKHVEWVILNSYEEEEFPPEMPVLCVGAVEDCVSLTIGAPDSVTSHGVMASVPSFPCRRFMR